MPLAGDIPQPSSETEEILAEQSGAGAPVFTPKAPTAPHACVGPAGAQPTGLPPHGHRLSVAGRWSESAGEGAGAGSSTDT